MTRLIGKCAFMTGAGRGIGRAFARAYLAEGTQAVDGDHCNGGAAMFARLENLPFGAKKRHVAAHVPFGRIGTAADLSGIAVFLASDDAAYVLAQTYTVDGENLMR